MQTGAGQTTGSGVSYAAGWSGLPRLRSRAGARSPEESAGVLVAELTDGPLAGTTREVSAIEGRPPKTLDIDSGGRTLRYCLAQWEQSGHRALYGYLYDV